MNATENKGTSTIPWLPFGEKHKEYIRNALNVSMSVAEGAIRSAKTVDHCIIACMYLETCPDTYHLATGSTVGNAKLNIGVCNGFGLEALFRGRCRWGKFKDNEALYIDTQTGEKVVIFAGGRKADSYKSILGNSYGLWIATEINEHFDSDNSQISFVKVALGRQIAARKPLTLWDLNPSYPGHPIYRDYIDKYREEGLPDGYQYQHFTIYDNAAISKERIAQIEARYIPGTVWHSRDILGQRKRAEGLCYQYFADNMEKFKTDKRIDEFIQVGIDIGGNGSAHTFCACGLRYSNDRVHALYARKLDARGTTTNDIIDWFGKCIREVEDKYGHVSLVRFESAEQVIKRSIQEAYPHIEIENSVKYTVMGRVRCLNLLTEAQPARFRYTEDAQLVADAMSEAIYDPKKSQDARLDDGTTDIDTMDAFEYSWCEFIGDLSRVGCKSERQDNEPI